MKTFSRYERVLLLALGSLGFGVSAVSLSSSSREVSDGGSGVSAPVVMPAAPAPVPPAEDAEENRAEEEVVSHCLRGQVLAAREAAAIVCLFTVPSWQERDKFTRSLTRAQWRHLFERLQSFPASEERDESLTLVVNSSTDQSFAVGSDLIATVKDPALEKALARDWIHNWLTMNNGDEETARGLLERGIQYFDEKEVRDCLSTALRHWATPGEAPEAAMRFTERAGLDAETLAALGDAVSFACMMWGYDDLPGVTAWAAAMPDADPRKNPALVGMLHGLTAQSPEKARAFVDQQIRADNPSALEMARVVGEGSFGIPTAAEQWAATLPAPARDAVLRAMIQTWILEADVEWQADRGTPQAARWADTLSPNAARGTAWEVVAATWARYEPTAARNWVRSLPTGADRAAATTTYDRAVAEEVETFSSGDPAHALDLLRDNLLDATFSAQQIQARLARWAAKTDPVFPRMWAASHGVPMPVPPGDAH